MSTGTPVEGKLARALEGPAAAWLTHGCLLVLTGVYLALLLAAPLWIALVPGVILVHRVGTLLHEYIHGIPFRRYRANHAVVTVWDGLLLMFGTMEMFRVSHLLHHQWLNSDEDDARRKAETIGRGRMKDVITGIEVVQYFVKFIGVLRGDEPRTQRGRILASALISGATIAAFVMAGRGDVPAKMGLITVITVLVPVSLRSAIEHYNTPDSPGFANEYRVWVPLFNLNRHVHHHEDPSIPWYRLRWRTACPLPRWHYVAHWFHVYLRRDYELMRPMRARDVRRERVPSSGRRTSLSRTEPGLYSGARRD